MAADADRLRVRNPVVGPRGGGLYVSELQYARLLESTFAIVAKDGYQGLAVRRVAERAGMSSKTFYDLFADREDCFLAAFDYAVSELTSRVGPVYKAEKGWLAQTRAGLAALLMVLDGEPALRRLLFLEAMGVGPKVLARRAEVSRELAVLLDGGRVGVRDAEGLPPLIAEGVVGAAFAVIHAHLSEQKPEPLVGLLGALMAAIVLPYRGRAAAARELTRENPPHEFHPEKKGEGGVMRPLGSAPPVDFRLTIRTQAVLTAVATRPGVSNREVAELAGIHDQGQVSRLMMRLLEQGLAQDTRHRGAYGRSQKAWRLTPQGEEVLQANGPLQPTRYAATRKQRQPQPPQPRTATAKAKTSASTTVAEKHESVYRATPRTQLVLTAVARLSSSDSQPSNREIAKAAGVKDQGQISKILRRLQGYGLLVNTGGATAGVPNAWQLTPRGEEILQLGLPDRDQAKTKRAR